MRHPHAQTGLRRTLALAVIGAAGATGAALVASIWLSWPPAEAETTAIVPGRSLAATPTATLPAPPRSGVDPPAPELAPRPVQSLAPPAVTRPTTPPAWGAPRAFGSLDVTLLEPGGKPAVGAVISVSAPRTTWGRQGPAVVADESGHAMWPAVPAETELQVGFTDALGFDVGSTTLTLEPGERRELTQRIDAELSAVVVRVADGSGAGLAAQVTLQAVRSIDGKNRSDSTRSTSRLTDSSGRAAFPGLSVQRVSVWAQAEGFAPLWRDDITLDHDPLEIALIIERGSGLDVQIVDDVGRPRDVDSVALTGTPMTVLAEHVAPGWYRFVGVPRAATGLVASAQGRRWSVRSLAGPVVQLVVPASGSLSVSWSELPLSYEPNGVFISSEPPAWGWFEPLDAATRAARGPVLFENLAPGDYIVRLNCPDAPVARSKSPDARSPEATPNLSAPAVVVSRQIAEVRIEP